MAQSATTRGADAPGPVAVLLGDGADEEDVESAAGVAEAAATGLAEWELAGFAIAVALALLPEFRTAAAPEPSEWHALVASADPRIAQMVSGRHVMRFMPPRTDRAAKGLRADKN
ncbi:MAG: hypothetical protein J2P25_00575 [Nocardiopsaceae bacterium]|nr:hypothetical protein [Nocardiopsaceae bacterium]